MNRAEKQRSVRLYGFLLKLYPNGYRQEFGEEMEYVFSESLQDAYTENGNQGVVHLWARTIVDAGSSLVQQHVENLKRGSPMNIKNTDILMQNKIFAWLALATGLVLLVPLVAMQFTHDVVWTLPDFIAAGTLLFGTGFIFVLVARWLPKHRLAAGLILAVALVYLWAELAVGIFTNWGS